MTLLRGKTIRLRPVERQDLAKRVDWINDPVVQATLNFDVPVSLVGTEKWLERVAVAADRKDFTVTTGNGEPIGFGGLIGIDRVARKAEIYGTIGEETYRGRGLGTELYSLLTDYGFLELGLERIFAYQLTHNIAAHRLLEKLGWTREGCLRRDLWSHGKLVDRFVVSILRDEWVAARQIRP